MTRSRHSEGGARRPTEKDLAVFLDLVECLGQNEDDSEYDEILPTSPP